MGFRPCARIDTVRQWQACAQVGTTIDEDGAVQLARRVVSVAESMPLPHPAGLELDRWSRVVRTLPEAGLVVLGSADGEVCDRSLRCPTGLAIDDCDRIYVVDAARGTIDVVPGRQGQRRRTVSFRTATSPRQRAVDVATHCGDAWVLLQRPLEVARLRSGRAPLRSRLRHPRGLPRSTPKRIAVRCGFVLVLWRDERGRAVIADATGRVVISSVNGASDIAVTPTGILIVAGGPGQPFRRFAIDGRAVKEVDPLGAPGYDGRGIAVDGEGSVVYWSEQGLRWADTPVATYERTGTVITYRLDAGQYRNQWGRVFVEACLPPQTSIRVGFITTDDDVEEVTVVPPAAPTHAVERVLSGEMFPLYRRTTAPDLEGPSSPAAAFFEAPVQADRGRYLWVVIRLTGTDTSTPRVAGLRVEKQGHRLFDELPAIWSRNPADSAFLQHFLSPLEGLLHELDVVAEFRHLLLDPTSARAETLDWLARFCGLVLDRTWPERARRTAIAEASWLFRTRGTLAATERWLEIYLGFRAPIVEAWRTRGLGGAVLGNDPTDRAAMIVGQGCRVGGTASESGFETHAHRFAVFVRTTLSTDDKAAVTRILDTHKPAHTTYTICPLEVRTVDGHSWPTGMSVGRHSHLGITSVVGPSLVDTRCHDQSTAVFSVGARRLTQVGAP